MLERTGEKTSFIGKLKIVYFQNLIFIVIAFSKQLLQFVPRVPFVNLVKLKMLNVHHF